MPTVKSKYENPDKYIEKLKIKNERAQGWVKYYQDETRQLRGRRWFYYADGVTKEVVHTTDELMGAKLNQSVVILGHIVGYTKDGPDKHRITISLENVALKD